jgi:hypothetical protein
MLGPKRVFGTSGRLRHYGELQPFDGPSHAYQGALQPALGRYLTPLPSLCRVPSLDFGAIVLTI